MFPWSRWIDKPQNILHVSMMWTISWKLFCPWPRNSQRITCSMLEALLKSSFDKQAAWRGVLFVQKSAWKSTTNGQASLFVYVRLFMLNSDKRAFSVGRSVRRSINDNYWSTISHNLADRPPHNLSLTLRYDKWTPQWNITRHYSLFALINLTCEQYVRVLYVQATSQYRKEKDEK